MIGHEVTNLKQEYPSFPHEDVPIYYDASHHQLKDEELLIYDDLDLTILDSWTLERDTRAQATSLTWTEQQKNRVTASKFCDVYNWKRGMEKHAENFVAGTQLHQHFCKSDLIMAECTSPLLGKKKYYEYFASLRENVKVLPCGLVVSANELLTPNQFGFRPKLSTITGLAHFTDNIPQSLDKDLFTGAVFLDLS